MEQSIRTACLCFLVILISERVSATNICKEGINDAFQRLENPRFVFLVSGSKLWEFDRLEDKLVQAAIPVQKYFKGAPNSPDAVFLDDKILRFVFIKNYQLYFFTCTESSLDCGHLKTVNLNQDFKSRRVNFTIDAGFYYLKGMPRPSNSFKDPYYSHLFIKEAPGVDCRSPTTTRVFESICDMADVDKNLFPNYYKLNPNKERVLAAEVFFDRRTQTTDFLIVVNRTMRYTVNGNVKTRDLDQLFDCASSMIFVVSMAVLLVFQIVSVLAFLVIVSYFRAKSSPDDEAATTTINEDTTRTSIRKNTHRTRN